VPQFNEKNNDTKDYSEQLEFLNSQPYYASKKLLSSSQIFLYAVPARTITKKALVSSVYSCVSLLFVSRRPTTQKKTFGPGWIWNSNSGRIRLRTNLKKSYPVQPYNLPRVHPNDTPEEIQSLSEITRMVSDKLKMLLVSW